jgi:hypothetical protein
MTRTVCSTPRCPELAVFRGLCSAHRQTTSERGYGQPHATARLCLAETLPAPCAYGCGSILEGRAFVAAHVVDGDESAGWVAACGPCNERAKFGRLALAPEAAILRLDGVSRGTTRTRLEFA